MERRTRQKRAIEAVFEEHRNPLTALEIDRLAVREAPGLGIATVYRSLKALARDGRVACVEIPGQMPRYELADKGHHHHFLCRVCGGVFERKVPCADKNDGASAISGRGPRDHSLRLLRGLSSQKRAGPQVCGSLNRHGSRPKSLSTGGSGAPSRLLATGIGRLELSALATLPDRARCL